jgi:hypothetical protein
MHLFRFATSIYGDSDVVIGASWDLLPWFVGAGTAVILVHALVKAVAGAARRPVESRQ